jgi:hypothetical protein
LARPNYVDDLWDFIIPQNYVLTQDEKLWEEVMMPLNAFNLYGDVNKK